jgi:hypothetical protein
MCQRGGRRWWIRWRRFERSREVYIYSMSQ